MRLSFGEVAQQVSRAGGVLVRHGRGYVVAWRSYAAAPSPLWCVRTNNEIRRYETGWTVPEAVSACGWAGGPLVLRTLLAVVGHVAETGKFWIGP